MGLDSTTVSRHRTTVIALLTAVILVDQLAKWWAWRHASLTQINYGGNSFVGGAVSRLYAHPLAGAVLDFVDFGLLILAAFVLVRRRPPALVLVPGAVMVGGWISNLLDRLGTHYWTAPGSVRGAVDFIPFGRILYNVADVFIVCGTLLFILAVIASAWSKTASRPPPIEHRRPRTRAWLSAIASATCLVVAVGFGAVNYGGVTRPTTPPAGITAPRTR
jgi:lipoprotein signal peptidase